MRPDPRELSAHPPGGARIAEFRHVRAPSAPTPRRAAPLRHFGLSDCGPHRARNEDAFLGDGPLGLFIVCDGVGGRRSGEIAAAEAIACIEEFVTAALGGRDASAEHTIDDVAAIVRVAMQRASRAIFERGLDDARYTGMSTTASVVLVVDGHAVIGQVGDTRVYHARGEATRQLTEDHTLRNMRAQRGIFGSARSSHKSPITRALGLREDVDVDIRTAPFVAGDRLLLCTDGLHEHLEPDAVLTRLFAMDPIDAAPAAIRHARQRGGRDNVTAIFVEALAPL